MKERASRKTVFGVRASLAQSSASPKTDRTVTVRPDRKVVMGEGRAAARNAVQ